MAQVMKTASIMNSTVVVMMKGVGLLSRKLFRDGATVKKKMMLQWHRHAVSSTSLQHN